MTITRRDAIKGVLVSGAAAITGHTQQARRDLPPAFAGKHQPKPLRFDPAKLNGLSEKLIRSHHENN